VGDERRRGEVVELVRTHRGERIAQRRGIREVAFDEREAATDGGEVGRKARVTRPDHARHVVPAGGQELGEIRPVLAADAGDERSPRRHPMCHDGRGPATAAA
jgi:hypothetical protein